MNAFQRNRRQTLALRKKNVLFFLHSTRLHFMNESENSENCIMNEEIKLLANSNSECDAIILFSVNFVCNFRKLCER